MLPLLIVSSPVLLFCLLFAIGFASFLRCVWRLRDTDAEKPGHGFLHQKAINWQDGLLEQEAGLWDDGWFHTGRLDVDGVKQLRVHAYLDDQLRNVVIAVKRSNGEGYSAASFLEQMTKEEQKQIVTKRNGKCLIDFGSERSRGAMARGKTRYSDDERLAEANSNEAERHCQASA